MPSDNLRNTDLPAEERISRFARHVSAYYQHRSVESRQSKDLATSPSKTLPMPTSDAMSKEDYDSILDSYSLSRSEIAVTTVTKAEFREWTRRALFNDAMAQVFWPELNVDVVWCEHSVSVAIMAAWEYQNLREESDRKGVKGRPIKITMMPRANHFVSTRK